MNPGALIFVFFLAQAGDYVSQALHALDAKQPAAAEVLLRKAVDADSASVEAQFNLALVLGMEGKDAEAIAVYRKTLELAPRLFEADLNLGILLLRTKQPADAAAVLKEAVDLKPAELRPQLFYAEALFDAGDFPEAESGFRAVLAMDQKSALANLGLARSLLKQSKLKESAEFYRAAAALDPANRNSILELGAEYDKLGQNSDAMAIFREFPSNEAATKRLNQMLLAENDATAAIPNLEAAVKARPTTENRLTLADAYRQTGQTDKVEEQLKLAVAADPANFELHMAFGRTLRDNRRFAEAAREFQAAAALRPDSIAALNELAGVLIMDNQFDPGLAALDRVKALGKEIPGDIFLRAITLDKLHRNQPALEAYRQFLAVAGGKFPTEEFQARQRARIIEKEIGK